MLIYFVNYQFSTNEQKLERWKDKDELRTDKFYDQCANSMEIDKIDVINKKIEKEIGKVKMVTSFENEFK